VPTQEGNLSVDCNALTRIIPKGALKDKPLELMTVLGGDDLAWK